jgi:nucleotidyltransferase substrate binding protein (TIGR01987 family)
VVHVQVENLHPREGNGPQARRRYIFSEDLFMNHSPDIRWQQRFEYTLELTWKTVKDYLEQSGVVLSAVTPRQVIKDAFAARILDDGQTWIDMIDHRNLLSHTYDAEKFEEAVDAIHGRYLAAFAQVRDLLGARKNT